MANLGICRKCRYCEKIDPAVVDWKGNRRSQSSVSCSISPHGIILWEMDVPDDCPYILEHTLTQEDVAEFAETQQEWEDDET